MKIAQIAPAWIPIPPNDYGGTESVLSYLIEEQVCSGHEVTLLAPGDAKTTAKLISFFPHSLVPSGVPWQAPMAAFYHLFKSVEYVKKSEDFDIVHAHLSSPTDMFLFPLLASLSIPRVITLHARFPLDIASSWVGGADNLYMGWAPSIPIVAISESSRAQVPHPLNFVGVVHHGLPFDTFVSTGQKRGDFLVWIGRFIPEKGAHIAIEVAKNVGMPLVLAGTVDIHIQESNQYFHQAIKPYIDQKDIKYIGPVTLKQKIELLSQALGFLNPIQWEEPFGMVIIEAMAMGCPVISFPRGAAPELILHNKTGFLAQNRDEMVELIVHLNEIDREDMRQYVRSKFSVQIMSQNYISVYQKVILTSNERQL
jgi:glycosyltransferase involved in cell wall biosynthesis